MEDQEIWDLMGDLEEIGLGEELTKAYTITGFYEDGKEHPNNDVFTFQLVDAFIEANKNGSVDCFWDKLAEPKSPHIDPLVSSWFGDNYLIIKGDLTKAKATEEKLRKEFIVGEEIQLKDYKKMELSGTSGSYGATGVVGATGISGTSGYTGGSYSTVYSTSGLSGSWSTSGVTVSSSKTASTSSSKMVSTSLKIEMEIEDLKDPPEDEVETYGHPLWEKIKGKFGF